MRTLGKVRKASQEPSHSAMDSTPPLTQQRLHTRRTAHPLTIGSAVPRHAAPIQRADRTRYLPPWRTTALESMRKVSAWTVALPSSSGIGTILAICLRPVSTLEYLTIYSTDLPTPLRGLIVPPLYGTYPITEGFMCESLVSTPWPVCCEL